MKSKTLSLPIVLLSALLANCNSGPQSASQTESLDNAAKAPGQALVINQCGPTLASGADAPVKVQKYDTPQTIDSTQADQASRLAMLDALSAAPQTLLDIILGRLGAKIVIGPQATSLCHDTPFSAEERIVAGAAATNGISSCWLAPSGGEPLRLAIVNDPKLIRFSMLRLLAYTYTQYIATRLANDPAAPADMAAAAHRFVADNQRLAAAFYADQGKPVDPASISDSTGYMVYANAIDSYYCSAQEQQSFHSQFPQTWAVFTDAGTVDSPLRQMGAQ
jgi:hypothetical protein